MKRILYLTCLSSIALFSCEKKNEPTPSNGIFDTIKPLNYFPAFPGSYWIYSNNDTLKVADQYGLCIFNSAGWTSQPDMDTLVLPKLILNGIYNYNDSIGYVYEYSISKEVDAFYRDPAFKTILVETEGGIFGIGGPAQGHQEMGSTIKVDTSITIGNIIYDSVLVTLQFDIGCPDINWCSTKREFYAKNIGLIRRDVRVNQNFVTVFELVDYYIAQ